ncbi:MAG TPA: VWA domain-containing protein [Acidimicrobiales bacterium]|nr:VWA domain-containing protein [Acidimicrobiales bacterium]
MLRRAGIDVPTGAAIDFVAALALVGLGSRDRVRHAGRATLVRRPEDLPTYERVFAAWWEGAGSWRPSPTATTPVTLALDEAEDGPAPGGDDGADDRADDVQAVRFSAVEVLRHKDLAALDRSEWAEASRLLAALRVGADLRRTRRLRPTRHPTRRPDLRATLRRSLRTGGEPLARPGREPSWRPRRLVLLADVSGSMEPYARACLRFAQAAVAARRGGDVEVFALGTRLTRLTRQLATRDAEVALRRAADEVVDWSGGTRLGDGLAAFNDRFGVRGMARGAVVVVLSDGWDRGDPDRLGAEMARLQRVASRVVWVNPLKATPGYAPLARGMAAALPHVDEFVEGHSLAALDDLAAIVAGRRPGRRRSA